MINNVTLLSLCNNLHLAIPQFHCDTCTVGVVAGVVAEDVYTEIIVITRVVAGDVCTDRNILQGVVAGGVCTKSYQVWLLGNVHTEWIVLPGVDTGECTH